jgi:hypothetical protein
MRRKNEELIRHRSITCRRRIQEEGSGTGRRSGADVRAGSRSRPDGRISIHNGRHVGGITSMLYESYCVDMDSRANSMHSPNISLRQRCWTT